MASEMPARKAGKVFGDPLKALTKYEVIVALIHKLSPTDAADLSARLTAGLLPAR
jgi:hypothetical protein